MGYLSDITLIGVASVNIVSSILFCMLDTKATKNRTKKIMIAGVCLLSLTLIFDLVCLVGFIKCGVVEKGAIFILFFPLLGYFLYDSIKELKKTAR